MVTAVISAFIGERNPRTAHGTSSRAVESSSSTVSQMSIGAEKRMTARTRCASSVSNQNDPTTRFQRASRGVTRISRRVIRFPSGSVMTTESPEEKKKYASDPSATGWMSIERPSSSESVVPIISKSQSSSFPG
jgi:hypothetical protein